MLVAVVVTVSLVAAPLVLGLWHRTVRDIVARLCHLVVDPIDELINATRGCIAGLRSTLAGLREGHGWNGSGALVNEVIVTVILAALVPMLLLAEGELWLASFAVAFGGAGVTELPFGLSSRFGIPFNPGASAAWGGLAASVVFAVRAWDLWHSRRRDGLSWPLGARLAVLGLATASLVGVVLVAAQLRTTQSMLQQLELQVIDLAPTASGFSTGTVATGAGSAEATPAAAAVRSGTDARRDALLRDTERHIELLNIGVSLMVIAALGYAMHGAMSLLALGGAAVLALMIAGVWCLQYVCHGVHLVVHGLAQMAEWMTRAAGLALLPLSRRMSPEARRYTDLDSISESSDAIRVAEMDPASPPGGGDGRLLHVDGAEAEPASAGTTDAWDMQNYDPFAAAPGQASNTLSSKQH